MEDIKLESLKKSLEKANVEELPNEFIDVSSTDYWIKAIVLVRKHNNTVNFALCEKNAKGEPIVVADFGMMSPIEKIEKCYPYLYLDKNLIPKFTDINDVKEYIIGIYGEEYRDKIQNATKEQIKMILLKITEKKQDIIADDKIDEELKEEEQIKDASNMPKVEEVPTIDVKTIDSKLKEKRGKSKRKK